jgi:hypothetical protein
MENHVYSANYKKSEYKITEKYVTKIKHWVPDVNGFRLLVRYLCEFSRGKSNSDRHCANVVLFDDLKSHSRTDDSLIREALLMAFYCGLKSLSIIARAATKSLLAGSQVDTAAGPPTGAVGLRSPETNINDINHRRTVRVIQDGLLYVIGATQGGQDLFAGFSFPLANRVQPELSE